MNMMDARFRGWYYGGEATEYLSGKVGRPIEPETVFVAAIRPKGVRLFLHVPPIRRTNGACSWTRVSGA